MALTVVARMVLERECGFDNSEPIVHRRGFEDRYKSNLVGLLTGW